MKKGRLVLWLIILVTVLLAVSGCAAGYQQRDSAPGNESAADQDYDSGQSTDMPDMQDRRIVRNAKADLSAEDVLQTYEQILIYLESKGGYEASRDQRVQNELVSIDARLRLPPEALDGFLDYINEITEVVNQQISTEDITTDYFDAATRLASMEKSLEQYYTYLESSDSIEESLMVQSEISRLTVEIEALKGRLLLWDTQLKESTVDLRIRQINDPLTVRREIDWSALSLDDMGYLIQSGLKTVLNVMIGALQWLAIILVAASPIWVPIIVIVVVILKRRKKRHIKASQQVYNAAQSSIDQANVASDNDTQSVESQMSTTQHSSPTSDDQIGQSKN